MSWFCDFIIYSTARRKHQLCAFDKQEREDHNSQSYEPAEVCLQAFSLLFPIPTLATISQKQDQVQDLCLDWLEVTLVHGDKKLGLDNWRRNCGKELIILRAAGSLLLAAQREFTAVGDKLGYHHLMYACSDWNLTKISTQVLKAL